MIRLIGALIFQYGPRWLVNWWFKADSDPCKCTVPSPVVIYDANGWKRWCGKCRGSKP